jgi:hypothetical protein
VFELLLTLLVLYGLQCVALLPRDAELFVRLGGTWRLSEGPGWRVLHPWPSAASWLASRSPLVEEGDVLCTRGPTPALGADFAEGNGVRVVPGGGQAVKVRGSRVWVAGELALRGTTKLVAQEAAELLTSLAAEGADTGALLQGWQDRAFASDALTEARASAEDATRGLGIASDVSLAALLVVLPALSAWLGAELALLWFAPGYLVLHGATLLLLARAHAVLQSGAGDRFEVLFSAALYPPLLLRSAADLRRKALAGFHPAAVAAEVLPLASALDFLRAELSTCADVRERDELAAVVTRLGCTWEELFAPPETSDHLALSYCPACRTEYRVEDGACVDCGAPLSRLPNASPA